MAQGEQEIGRRAAHRQEPAHPFVDRIETAVREFVLDQAGKGRLVERIEFARAPERLMRRIGSAQPLQAAGDRQEQRAADAGGGEQGTEEGAGGGGIAQSLMGEGQQAVQARLQVRGKRGMRRAQGARRIERGGVAVRGDVGFDHEQVEGNGLPAAVPRVACQLRGQRGEARGGRDIRQREAGAGVGGKRIEKRRDLAIPA